VWRIPTRSSRVSESLAIFTIALYIVRRYFRMMRVDMCMLHSCDEDLSEHFGGDYNVAGVSECQSRGA